MEGTTMTAKKKFENRVVRVNLLAAIRDRLLEEDTSEADAAADLLQQMIEREGRQVTAMATCFPSLW
jgi:hypothetical protein